MALASSSQRVRRCGALLIRRSTAPATALTLAALVLSACVLVTPPPARTFDLSAPLNVAGVSGGAGQLLIVEPAALQALNSANIVVRPAQSEINYFPQAQWADTLPRLLQAKIQQGFESTGRARAVGKPGDGLIIDYQILTNIRAFELDAATNTAMVSLSVKIVNDRNGQVVGSRDFQATAPAASDGVDDAVFALDGAMDTVLAEMIRWTFRRV